MKLYKLILLIFLLRHNFVGAQSNLEQNYSCNGTISLCVFKNFESSEKFEAFLNGNSEVYYTSYDRYYGRNQRSSHSMSGFLNVELKDFQIEKISSILFKRFSKMKKLIGENLGLKELKSEDFRPADDLKVLRLSNNKIRQLENVQFIYLKSIEEIDLSHNKISSIHDGAFDKIGVNLTKIDLSYNEIGIFKEEFLWLMIDIIKSQTLNINLEHNVIAEWEASDKNKSTSLVLNLNLSDNKIKSFKLQNVKVSELLLSNNEIEEFDANFDSIDIRNNKIKELKINSDCTSVFASRNEISEIFFTPGNSPQVLNFDVSHNNLKVSQNFHDFLKSQKKISNLGLSHNFFGSFALDDFADMEKLQKLSLSNTGMTEIPFGLFAHLQSLQSLNLSQNNLKEIDFHVFSSLSNLETLDISGNSLSKINDYEKLKEVMPKLQNIGLEGNNWNCEFLSKLKINLKSQSIDIIEPVNRTKDQSSVMGIKCIENSDMKIFEVKNGTVDDVINQKLNEVINKVNHLDEKVSKIKSNETNFMSLIVNNQKDILALRGEKIQAQLSTANFTNTNEVKMLIEQMNNNTMDRMKISIDQLVHKINELALKIEQNKLEAEKIILASQKDQKNVRQFEKFSPLKSSDEKVSGITTVEFFLGILLATTLTLLIILVIYQTRNYARKNSLRMPRMSGRNTPNTIVTYDSQSIQ